MQASTPRDRSAEESAGGGYHARIREAKRHAALDAAFELFVESGYADTTLQQIAARAGISTATLFKRFPSKAALFEAIVLEVWSFDPTLAGQASSRSTGAGLREIGQQLAARLRDARMLGFYRVFVGAIREFPELGAVMLERGKLPFVRQIEAFLRSHGPYQGASGKDLTDVASQFLAMIADRVFWPCLLVQKLAISDAESDDVVDQAARTVLARLVVSADGRGLAPRVPTGGKRKPSSPRV